MKAAHTRVKHYRRINTKRPDFNPLSLRLTIQHGFVTAQLSRNNIPSQHAVKPRHCGISGLFGTGIQSASKLPANLASITVKFCVALTADVKCTRYSVLPTHRVFGAQASHTVKIVQKAVQLTCKLRKHIGYLPAQSRNIIAVKPSRKHVACAVCKVMRLVNEQDIPRVISRLPEESAKKYQRIKHIIIISNYNFTILSKRERQLIRTYAIFFCRSAYNTAVVTVLKRQQLIDSGSQRVG